MATGTIKKVVSDRGFGFITAEDAKDYFFHRDGLDASLNACTVSAEGLAVSWPPGGAVTMSVTLTVAVPLFETIVTAPL